LVEEQGPIRMRRLQLMDEEKPSAHMADASIY
jgi:hypothetical protein